MRLAKETVTIELKNGNTITGTITGVDSYMNIHLRAVKMMIKTKTKEGEVKHEVEMDQTTVRGNTIRNIELPESINLDTLLVDNTPKIKVKAHVKGLLHFTYQTIQILTPIEALKKKKEKAPKPNK